MLTNLPTTLSHHPQPRPALRNSNRGRQRVSSNASLLARCSLVILALLFLEGCVSQYGYDNLLSPNWDNRHAKFLGVFIDGRVGLEYKRSCPGYCQLTPVDANTDRYTFTDHPRKGCIYWYDVAKSTGRIVTAQFKGTKEACSLTLN